MGFSTLTELGNYLYYLIPEHFHQPKNQPHTYQPSLILPSTHTYTSPGQGLSMDLTILDMSYKWNHTMGSILSLASLA